MISEDGLALYSSKSKSDIWSVGMMLLEMVVGTELLTESRTKLAVTLRKVMSWIHAKGSAAERIIQEAEVTDQWKVNNISLLEKNFWLIYSNPNRLI